MKKTGLILFAGAIAILLAMMSSYAQPGPGMMWRGSGGWGPGTPYNRMYDPKAMETISGEVTSIDRITPNKGMAAGIHMNVKTDQDTISVHLGPSWYLENQDVKICLLYTSDAADERSSVDLGGRRIIKKK